METLNAILGLLLLVAGIIAIISVITLIWTGALFPFQVLLTAVVIFLCVLAVIKLVNN